MKAIWKYPLRVTDLQAIEMPKGAQVLTAQTQNGSVCIWALVDPSEATEKRAFAVIGTGHPIEQAEQLRYVSTFQIHGGSLVFHVFEVI